MLQRRMFSNGPIVAIVDSSLATTSALAKLGTPSAGAVCRAADVGMMKFSRAASVEKPNDRHRQWEADAQRAADD